MNSPFVRRTAAMLIATGLLATTQAEVNKVEIVAPGVYFHEGDLGRRGHCNNGWIVFSDFVLVIDANFPSGALEVLPKIKATTAKPVRFAFDTHHHGDHAYGNQIWADQGASIVAHSGVLAEMKKYETGRFGDKPGRWEDAARNRPDVAASKLHPPTVLFDRNLVFDDGTRRVELLHFGTAHTQGDGWAWLPKERILFTGDACVNGPYNYTGDGNLTEWIQTLEKVKQLKPRTVCPAHGPMGGPELLEEQQLYFSSLLGEVRKLKAAGKSAAEAKAAVDTIKETIRKNDRIMRYIGQFFPAQVEKAWTELGGQPFEPKPQAQAPIRLQGRELVSLPPK